MSEYALHLGDCVEIMKRFPDNSVDSVVTDPPYEIGFMGKSWDASGIAYNPQMWAEVLRVLKPGGHLLAFSGSRTYHRMTCAIEDAGFQIRDQIMWVYGSGFPKSRNLDGQWQGWGTALKPAHEPICVARKPLVGTVAANVLEYGTGAPNIDGCRVGDDAVKTRINTAIQGGRFSAGDGRGLSQEVSEHVGRWPANLIHDGSDEVLAAFPDAKGQQGKITGNEPTANGFSGAVKFGGMIGRIASHEPRIELEKSAARFFYCAKASRKDRNEGLKSGDVPAVSTNATMREREDADWSARNGNYHPTVKPTELMKYLCRLVTPAGGIVLDPFMGSGSTGKAAGIEGFDFIGIELSPQYLTIAEGRIQKSFEKSRCLSNIGSAPLVQRDFFL
ncbi:DNA-methyltransferase [Undibacterium crateris]|uniref:DNA-methyltransferase n=1 Tax=Undibacterium crateris TaxID=2528175 RepID=UPI00138999BC|nr:site-specific DNA-methyltransferase [Undibacterium crateris]NDI85110.1 site-specific DNA-methyltransferase [Undibacterium crateris]